MGNKQIGLIKADDMQFSTGHAISPQWQAFLDFMAGKKIKACIGLIGNSLEKGNTHYIDRLKQIHRLDYFEFFNHGYDHLLDQVDEHGEKYHEFFNTPFQQQREHLLKTQNLAKEKLNITLHTFGAPGNCIDNNTTSAVESVDDIKIWLFGNPCPSRLVLTNWLTVETTTSNPDYNAFLRDYKPGVEYYVLQIHPNGWTDANFNVFKKILDYLIQKEMTFLLPSEYLELVGGSPEIALSRSGFNFGCERGGPFTPAQTMRIDNQGKGTLKWTVTGIPPWFNVNPSSGTGPAAVSISVNSTALPPGNYPGSFCVEASNAVNSPQTVNVNLAVFNPGSAAPPFGEFSTPFEGSTVSGSIALSGWALDDIGVESVKIYSGDTYVGDAVFIEGARPDLESAYPGNPRNYRAGWGYMMLTHCLPGGGNGVYTLNAFAVDVEGHQVKLGSKTITVDNQHAVKPFGAIDTPAQGGIASGSRFANYGWALTPRPNTIPKDGATIRVFVDGVEVGHPVYNIYRPDIDSIFPAYANSKGAGGCCILDTTVYKNGIHTLSWLVTDDKGNSEGIGSRYFIIDN